MASQHFLAVMGVTGVGKSSFIKLVTGDGTVKVSDSMDACTKEVSAYETSIMGRRITLVDTPGFDDEELTDSEVLKILLDWLVSTYRRGQKLSGILYLHRLTDARMRNSAVRNLSMFRELIGENFYRNLTLGTSCWSLVTASVGAAREQQLKTEAGFWKMMIEGGARAVRLPDDRSDARGLVYEMVSHSPAALEAQIDAVERCISFADLAVTKTVQHELEQARKARARQQEMIEREVAAAKQRREREAEERMQELHQLQTRRQRMLEYTALRRYCPVPRPSGYCRKYGCWEKLRHYDVVWHCCACDSNTHSYWQCGSCGEDCGNDEHPYMAWVDNSGICTVM